EVKQFGNDNQMRIVTQYRYDDESPEATEEVNAKMYEALAPLYSTAVSSEVFINENIVSSDKVGPSIAQDMRDNAILAVFFSLIAIGLYIVARFKKWQWAVGGVASLLHDAFLVIGVFTLLHGILPFQLDVDQSFIAAILTIIGFSINDTVVIFDRIREYQTLYPKRDIKDNINGAINSTLARTINTSGTTFVVLFAMFVFGSEVIRGFIFALMFGVIVGTFSSVFVATPVAYDFMKKKLTK
ncbi:MAG: protein translocase subunit SecF, partial [Rikenellaceae bacterium]